MLNVNINQCRDVISQCSHSWLYLLQYLDKINTFLSDSIKLQKKIGVDFSKALPGGRTTGVLNWAKEANMVGKLNACKDGQCGFATARDICHAFLSYEKPVYLKEGLRMMESKNPKGEKVENTLSLDTHGNRSKEYFGKADLMTIKRNIDKYLSGGKKGRILIGPSKDKSPNKPAIVHAVQNVASAIVAGVAEAINQGAINPFFCKSDTICKSEIAILQVSQCTQTGVNCASTGTCYV